MSLEVAFHDAAAEEYEAALQWYENQRPALADALRDGVRAALERILAGPGDFPFVRDDIRTVTVKRFPYSSCIGSSEIESSSSPSSTRNVTRESGSRGFDAIAARRDAATPIYACRPRGESP